MSKYEGMIGILKALSEGKEVTCKNGAILSAWDWGIKLENYEVKNNTGWLEYSLHLKEFVESGYTVGIGEALRPKVFFIPKEDIPNYTNKIYFKNLYDQYINCIESEEELAEKEAMKNSYAWKTFVEAFEMLCENDVIISGDHIHAHIKEETLTKLESIPDIDFEYLLDWDHFVYGIIRDKYHKVVGLCEGPCYIKKDD